MRSTTSERGVSLAAYIHHFGQHQGQPHINHKAYAWAEGIMDIYDSIHSHITKTWTSIIWLPEESCKAIFPSRSSPKTPDLLGVLKHKRKNRKTATVASVHVHPIRHCRHRSSSKKNGDSSSSDDVQRVWCLRRSVGGGVFVDGTRN
jgi:hypothetical protein